MRVRSATAAGSVVARNLRAVVAFKNVGEDSRPDPSRKRPPVCDYPDGLLLLEPESDTCLVVVTVFKIVAPTFCVGG
jgi:hypothetical protein